MRRFLAFDIETAKLLPAGVGDILAHRPLGIVCAAAVASDLSQPVVWFGKDDAGEPSARMTGDEATWVVGALAAFASQGYTLLTWNGVKFDFDVLGEESGQVAECARLAADHVDMLFHVVCVRGHRVSLQKAAEGMGLPGKQAGVSGAAAPEMWAAGKRREVIEYCIQDVRLTLQLAEACERAGHLAWMTQRGDRGRMPLPQGWLTVRDAKDLPAPDTSWMPRPPSREDHLRWVRAAGCL